MRIFFLTIIFFGTLAASASPNSDPYQYFDNGDVKIAYRVFGTGAPLFLLNGGPGRSSDTFTELAQILSSKNRSVIIFDQRGTGRSKLKVADETTITLDLMVGDLEALRKYLHFNKVDILGHSFGGMYAMAYAVQYPQNIRALILSASGGVDLSWQDYSYHNMLSRLTQKSRNKIAFWTSPEQQKKDPTRSFLESTRLLVPAYIYHQKFVPKLVHDLANLNYSNPDINNLVWKSMEKYDLKGAFKNFQAPTLIIDGRQDILGEAVPIGIHNEIPNSRLELLDECSHYPWLDSPDKYFSLINDFLG